MRKGLVVSLLLHAAALLALWACMPGLAGPAAPTVLSLSMPVETAPEPAFEPPDDPPPPALPPEADLLPEPEPAEPVLDPPPVVLESAPRDTFPAGAALAHRLTRSLAPRDTDAVPAAVPVPTRPPVRLTRAPHPALALVRPRLVTGQRRAVAYPLAARRRGLEGTVMLRVLVARDGSVGAVEVERSSGHAVLDEAATRAARRWRFEPARRGGTPVPYRVRLPVEFELS